ncbi:MAG: carbohydrate-binding domain-containing protein, partial [Lautropia sp.]|nr:carbohydrate-binding domain-containing protein [Lautropia sp.]
MSLLRYRPLVLALAAAGLTACGGDDSSSSADASAPSVSSTPGAAANAEAVIAQTPGTTTATANGACTIPAVAAVPDAQQVWDINTGAFPPDQVKTDDWLPLNIALDTLNVTSSSPCFAITKASDTVTNVNINGQPAISITRDAHGLNIQSTTVAPVAFRLSGTGNTPITLNSNTDYALALNNANITSPDGPAINLQSAKTAFIDLQGENTLRDSANWTKRTTPAGEEMDLKATMFAEGPMVFRGTGSLTINGTPQHAL